MIQGNCTLNDPVIPDEPEITLLVVNYRTLDLIQRCLESVLAYYPSLAMLVIDNGSQDESTRYIRCMVERYPHIHCIINPCNRHHGPALDQGLQAISTPWVFTLDSDCTLIRPGFLEEMGPFFQDAALYAVGELVYLDRFGYEVKQDTPGASAYIHPRSMLIDRKKYLVLKPFRRHGAPALANMQDAVRKGYKLLEFPVQSYLYHQGRGTCARYGYGLGLRHQLEHLLWQWKRFSERLRQDSSSG